MGTGGRVNNLGLVGQQETQLYFVWPIINTLEVAELEQLISIAPKISNGHRDKSDIGNKILKQQYDISA